MERMNNITIELVHKTAFEPLSEGLDHQYKWFMAAIYLLESVRKGFFVARVACRAESAKHSSCLGAVL